MTRRLAIAAAIVGAAAATVIVAERRIAANAGPTDWRGTAS